MRSRKGSGTPGPASVTTNCKVIRPFPPALGLGTTNAFNLGGETWLFQNDSGTVSVSSTATSVLSGSGPLVVGGGSSTLTTALGTALNTFTGGVTLNAGTITDARLAFAGVSDVPARATAAEELLEGERPTAELFD